MHMYVLCGHVGWGRRGEQPHPLHHNYECLQTKNQTTAMHLFWLDTRPLHSSLNRNGPQLCGRKRRETPPETADWCPNSTDDHDLIWSVALPVAPGDGEGDASAQRRSQRATSARERKDNASHVSSSR